jgi:phospholipid-binding lipoprotein MlaA
MTAKRFAACLALAGMGILPVGSLARAGQAPAGGVETAQPEDKDPFEKEEAPAPPLADPLRGMNRAFFGFNDTMYFWALKPTAKGYKAVVPQSARVRVANFFSNLGTPVRVFSCLLQGDLKGTGTELARLGVNTTVGVLGFGDPAKSWLKLKKRDEDFGQTFGAWGMGPGCYFNWPLLGPSCARDTLALPLNAILDPVTFFPGASLIQKINYTSLHLGEYDDLKKGALDPYVAIRDAYNQNRRHAIRSRD